MSSQRILWKSEKWEDEYGITEPKDRVKLTLMRFAYLHSTVVSYKLKEKTPPPPNPKKKVTACFIAVVWNPTFNTSELCLYSRGE